MTRVTKAKKVTAYNSKFGVHDFRRELMFVSFQYIKHLQDPTTELAKRRTDRKISKLEAAYDNPNPVQRRLDENVATVEIANVKM
ncbi:hypothetical protein AVEN_41101-1 [Araneus ventricosus]|uniref:Uncharacterized protein n=1 Tax=Araneus ventricosus TaxID=182803 RepID=A0A4Y2E9C9_ARAVE|nr:hypothetical protein AVEN_41101-1 [Araneus ventricosus]